MGATVVNVVKIALKIRPKGAKKAEILGSFFGELPDFGPLFKGLYIKIWPLPRKELLFGIYFFTFRDPGPCI